MRDLAEPPADIPAAELWRSLLPIDPPPERELRFRLRELEHVPFRVQAVPGMALERAREEGRRAAGLAEHLRDALAVRRVVALVVHAPWGVAFPAGELGQLDDLELRALVLEVHEALADVCPTYAGSNVKAWHERLVEGAKDASNHHEAHALAACADEGFATMRPRPDRYWGVPFRALCDGHWMAWRAARDATR